MSMRLLCLIVLFFSAVRPCDSTEPKKKTRKAKQAGSPVVEDALPDAKAVYADKRRKLPAKFETGHVAARAEVVKAKRTKSGFRLKFPSGTPVPTPTIAGGKLYVSGGFSSKEFYCFDAATGKQLWAVDLDDDGPTSAVIADGTVVINTESCTQFALDAATGKMRWSYYLGDPLLSTPTIANGRVFTVYPVTDSQKYAKPEELKKKKPNLNRLYTHALIAIELKTGKILWQRLVDTDCMTAPVASGDDLLVTTLSGTLFRFRQKTGKLQSAWRMRATSAPIVVGQRMMLTCRADRGERKIISEAIVQTSQQQSQFLTGSFPAPYLDPSIQMKADSTRKAGKFDGANGIGGGFGGGFGGGVGFFSINGDPDPDGEPAVQLQPAGKLKQPAGNGTAIPDDLLILTEQRAAATIGQGNVSMLQMFRGSRLLFRDGLLFNCMGNKLTCTDPQTGKTVWQQTVKGDLKKLGGHLATPPIAAGNRLLVATYPGDVLELVPRTGRVVRTHKIGAKLRFPPIVDRGRIYVPTLDGQLICIDTKDRTLTGWPMPGRDAAHSRTVSTR